MAGLLSAEGDVGKGVSVMAPRSAPKIGKGPYEVITRSGRS
jgi:hypothetical protein